MDQTLAALRAQLKAQDAEIEVLRVEINEFFDRDGAWEVYRWLHIHGVIAAIEYDVRTGSRPRNLFATQKNLKKHLAQLAKIG